jgi:hypothetical protein
LPIPTELTLHVGERVAIPLTSAGAVGYLWHLTVSGDTGAIEASTGPEQPPPFRTQTAGSAPQALFISGHAPGRASIQLRLMRPRQPPREAHDIMVTVTP